MYPTSLLMFSRPLPGQLRRRADGFEPKNVAPWTPRLLSDAFPNKNEIKKSEVIHQKQRTHMPRIQPIIRGGVVLSGASPSC